MALLHQPGAPVPDRGNWMPKPVLSSNVPHGLEYLNTVGHVFIKQVAVGWESRNKYVIMNGEGKKMYYAFEESDDCERMCCEKDRGFTIHITDNTGREVIRVVRVYNECAGCFDGLCAKPGGAFSHQVTVQAPPGRTIGTVSQRAPFSYQI